MHMVEQEDVASRLGELLEEAASGEEILIRGENGAAFKLIRADDLAPSPEFGSARGLIQLSEDFDAPLEDFKAYVP